MKKVAIITRTKDRPVLLPRAYRSVSSQTFKDFTWVVVNDGGQKLIVDEIAQKAALEKIDVVVIHNEKSNGMEAASNLGIKGSDSQYVVIHDDDDSWDPDFLKETVSFLDSSGGSNFGGVVTHSEKIEEKVDENSFKIIKKSSFNNWLSTITLMDLAKGNSFPPISFLYRREIYNILNGYDESLPVLGDWDFNLRFLVESDIFVLKKPLANYHLRVKNNKLEEYSNTVIHGIDKHKFYNSVLKNRYLRQDFKAGRIGLGFLVNMGGEISNLSQANKYRLVERVLIKIYQRLFK